MKILEFTLPAFWGPYLINNDPSGMDDAEIKAVDDWMEMTHLPAPCSCSGQEEFIQWHDARDVYPYAADCLVFTFLIHEEAA
jgi:hypothetical protein